MKRDARIGLAVVLVLGLAVTLLIGRALYKNKGDHLASTEGESAAGDAAVPYNGEVRRVEGADTGNAAANVAAPADKAATAAANTAAIPPLEQNNPGVQRFIDDQTSSAAPSRLNTSALTPPPAEKGTSGPAPAAANDKPPVDETLTRDHEHNSHVASSCEPDFFGYTVAPGDNGWKIAFKVYGDGKYTQKILDANPGLHADKLKVGSLIKIPAIPHKTILAKLPSYAEAVKNGGKHISEIAANNKKAAAKEDVAEAHKPAKAEGPVEASKTVKAETQGPSEATTHKVEAGETLASIAKQYYGFSGPKSVAKIVAANKGLDPDKLKVGQELAIPAK